MNTEIISPSLEVKKTQKNTLKHLHYYSFEDRVFDLADMFKSNLNEKYTNIIKAATYEGVADHYKGKGARKHHPIYNGVYKLAPMSKYMGYIPEINQKEINDKFQALKDNPFLKQNFKLVVLAPLNNFATDNNIKAIDPIAFAYFKEGKYCYEKNYLITLSQWI